MNDLKRECTQAFIRRTKEGNSPEDTIGEILNTIAKSLDDVMNLTKDIAPEKQNTITCLTFWSNKIKALAQETR